SPKIETIEGIAALSELTFLGLYAARRLSASEGLQWIPGLARLEVNDCPKVRDISPLSNLLELEELQLCNDGDIETLKPLTAHKALRAFLFYESTNIRDGNLGVLKALPKLEHVVF